MFLKIFCKGCLVTTASDSGHCTRPEVKEDPTLLHVILFYSETSERWTSLGPAVWSFAKKLSSFEDSI